MYLRFIAPHLLNDGKFLLGLFDDPLFNYLRVYLFTFLDAGHRARRLVIWAVARGERASERREQQTFFFLVG